MAFSKASCVIIFDGRRSSSTSFMICLPDASASWMRRESTAGNCGITRERDAERLSH